MFDTFIYDILPRCFDPIITALIVGIAYMIATEEHGEEI